MGWRVTASATSALHGQETSCTRGNHLYGKCAYGAGQYDAGLEAAAEGLDLVATNGERWWQAELHRLEGELLLARAENGEAQACSCFEHAVDISRRKKAKSLELRAATSVAQLWADQGERQKASNLLAPIFGWFSEGFETADLQSAKALLDETRLTTSAHG